MIAFARGGATETMIEGQKGVFFGEQSEDAIREAVDRFIEIEPRLDRTAMRVHAERFGVERFWREMRRAIEGAAESRKCI